MTDFLPKEVREGLEAARKADLRRKSTLRVHMGGEVYPILRFRDDGFTIDADGPHLRGLVDVYNGGNHLYQCLIVASEEGDGEMHYEFKRSTEAADRAPLDFHRDPLAPVALLRMPD